jgi:hypothetical protein
MPQARVAKIFDPADGFGPFDDPWVVTDSTVALRDGRWWMYVAGKLRTHPSIALFSASLPHGTPLGATGWCLRRWPTRGGSQPRSSRHAGSGARTLAGK